MNSHLDPDLTEKIVYEVKSQGLFDDFRKASLADVDTKPAYQNLKGLVENAVQNFLSEQDWSPEANKYSMRERMRKHIAESGFLDVGVERIVNQVVNPKINTVFKPRIEEVAYKYLGIPMPPKESPKPEPPKIINPLPPGFSIDREEDGLKVETDADDLLPTDLEQVSPDSDKAATKDELTNGDIKAEDEDDDEESPPFEPIIDCKSPVRSFEQNGTEDVKPSVSDLVPKTEPMLENKDVKNFEMKSSPTGEKHSDVQTVEEVNLTIDSQLSQVSSETRMSITSNDAHLREHKEQLQNVSANISEEAQMPKFSENSNESKPNATSPLHFDIKKDEIKFEGTDRNSINLHTDIDQEALNGKISPKENLQPSEVEPIAEDDFRFSKLTVRDVPETNIVSATQGSNFSSSQDDTGSAQLCIVEKGDTNSSHPPKKPEDEASCSEKRMSEKNSPLEKLPSRDERREKEKDRSKHSSSSSSSALSKHHRKHSSRDRKDDKDKSHSSSKDRSSSHHKSSKDHHSKSSSSNRKHNSSSSSANRHSSSTSSKSKSTSSDHQKSKTGSQSSSSSRSTSHRGTSSASKHGEEKKSRGDDKHHSSSSSSSRNKSKKEDSTSKTAAKDDHDESREKTRHRRKSSDSNDDDNQGSANGRKNVEVNAHETIHNESSSVVKEAEGGRQETTSSAPDASSAANASSPDQVQALNVCQSNINTKATNKIVILDEALQNPATDFIQIGVVIADSTTKIQSPECLLESQGDNSEELRYFESKPQAFTARLNSIHLAMEECCMSLDKLEKYEVSLKGCNGWLESDDSLNAVSSGDANNNDGVLKQTSTEKPCNETIIERSSSSMSSDNLRSSLSTSSKSSRINGKLRHSKREHEITANKEISAKSKSGLKDDIDHTLSAQKKAKIDTKAIINNEVITSPTPSEMSGNSKENDEVRSASHEHNTNTGSDSLKQRIDASCNNSNRLTQQQRYSSEDLYKPRPVLSQRSRRRGGLDAMN